MQLGAQLRDARPNAAPAKIGEEPFEPALDDDGMSNEAALYREFFRNAAERSQALLNPRFAIEATKLAWGRG